MPAGRPWVFPLLLWRSTLRQAEALDLQWRDPNFAAAAPVTVRKGKGGRSRVVPAHPELVTSSSRYPGAGPTTVYSTFLHGPRPGGSRRPCHGLFWRDLMFAAL